MISLLLICSLYYKADLLSCKSDRAYAITECAYTAADNVSSYGYTLTEAKDEQNACVSAAIMAASDCKAMAKQDYVDCSNQAREKIL